MHDTHGHSRLDRRSKPETPNDGLERFWAQEVERRRSRRRGWLASAVGTAGGLGTLGLFGATVMATYMDPMVFLVAGGAASAAGASSLWLTKRGIAGLWNSRPPSPPTRRPERGPSRRGAGSEKEAEWQVLEVLQRHGEVTPTRVALETALTVDEAQRKLSELAENGHLDVRVEGSKLVYAL